LLIGADIIKTLLGEILLGILLGKEESKCMRMKNWEFGIET